MATSKKPQPKNKASSKKETVAKTDQKVAVHKSPEPTGQIDFGDKLTWIFNSWRAIWEAFIINIGAYILAVLIPALVIFTAVVAAAAAAVTKVSDAVPSGISTGGLVIASVFILAALAVAAFFAPTIAIIQLYSVRGKKISISEAIDATKKFVVRYLLMYALIVLAIMLPVITSVVLMKVAIGFLLFPLAIVFALFVGFFTTLAPYLLIDDNLQVQEALNKSYEVTKLNWQWVLATALVVMIVSFIASIIFNVFGFFGNLLSSIVSAFLSFIIAFVYVKQIAK